MANPVLVTTLDGHAYRNKQQVLACTICVFDSALCIWLKRCKLLVEALVRGGAGLAAISIIEDE